MEGTAIMTCDLPQRRVVAPNGCDLGTFWTSVREGRSAAAQVTRFDTSELPNKIAGEVRDFDAGRQIGRAHV